MRPLSRNHFLVLVVLLRHPMHPYAIRQEIIQLSGHRVWLAYSSIGRALDSLLGRYLIEECSSNPNYWLKARRSAPYELTDMGYELARRELSMYYEIFVKSRVWLERLDV